MPDCCVGFKIGVRSRRCLKVRTKSDTAVGGTAVRP